MIFHCELVKTTKFAKLTINYYFFLISLQKTENVPSGKEQGATAVFAGYFVMAWCKNCKICKINDFSRLPCENYKIYKINDFSQGPCENYKIWKIDDFHHDLAIHNTCISTDC